MAREQALDAETPHGERARPRALHVKAGAPRRAKQDMLGQLLLVLA